LSSDVACDFVVVPCRPFKLVNRGEFALELFESTDENPPNCADLLRL